MNSVRRARRFVRRLCGRFAGWILGSRLLAGPRPSSPSATPAQIRAILVIRIDERVGNVLLTTPLLEALRARLPDVRIDLLVSASKRALVEGLAHTIPFEKKALFKRPGAFFALLFQLRRARYDVAIDASHWHDFSASSAMLLAWTAAPIRIAHERGEASRFATHLISGPEDELAANEIAEKLRLLEPLGIASERGRLATSIGRAGPARARIEQWASDNGLVASRIVGIAPGGRKPDHRAPALLFAELGREARRLGFSPMVLWGPGEQSLGSEVASASGAVLAPPTDLEEVAALMRLCAAVVTNDTGPMHLAVACEVPTIAIFTRSDHRRWGHDYAPNSVVAAAGRADDDVLAEAREALRRTLAAQVP